MTASTLKLGCDLTATRQGGRGESHLVLAPKEELVRRRGGLGVFRGEVLHGKALGRTLGFPTANIAVQGDRPSAGIYAARARLQDGRHRGAVAYFGDRPTVKGRGELLEVFLFDFNEDIYGQTLAVELIAFIRSDMTFDSLEAMTHQIIEDCLSARTILNII